MLSSYNTIFIGKVWHNLDKIDSTNNFALKLLKNDLPSEGTIVYTKSQVAGRGQRGNVWQSQTGKNITMSLILYPKMLLASQQFYLTQAISLAVCQFLKDLTKKNFHIKWPNDIFYKNKKIGGILIENTLRGSQLANSVIGIGININQTVFENLDNVTSLQLITGKEHKPILLAKKLCHYLEVQYLQLKADKKAYIKRDYLKSLYRYGELHPFQTPKMVFEGTIVDVLANGKLLVMDKNGRSREFGFKEVKFLSLI